MKLPAVFLDRDGVINRAVMRNGTPCPATCDAELQILPGVSAALRALRTHGYRLIVVTNQPDVARGTLSVEAVQHLHRRLQEQLPLDAVLTCFHDDADACDCRKPHPGLLLRAAHDFGLDMATSFLVGDRWRDTEAGRRAGCRTFFVDRGYTEGAPATYDFRVESLYEAAQIIISRAQSCLP